MKFASLPLALLPLNGFATSTDRNIQVEGYWQNWVDVSWWSEDLPGNCLMGCADPSAFMTKTEPYSSLNYGFVFLTGNPDPDKDSCESASDCPVWDGKGIYAAASSKQGATVVSAGIPSGTAASCSMNEFFGSSSGLVTIAENTRLGRMQPQVDYPKRTKIAFGGWSDWAAIGTTENAETIANLVGKMVLLSFADGVDLDFEHLTPFNTIHGSEFEAFTALVNAIRKEFDTTVTDGWYDAARTQMEWLNCTYNALEDWEKTNANYYPTNMEYMQNILANPVPHLDVSWTTRFNAFVPEDDPFNYLTPNSTIPDEPFETDNEGMKVNGHLQLSSNSII